MQQYHTLCRGDTSFLGSLRAEFPQCDLDQYVSIFALRQHGELASGPSSEQVCGVCGGGECCVYFRAVQCLWR
jgi:hypothetical protein